MMYPGMMYPGMMYPGMMYPGMGMGWGYRRKCPILNGESFVHKQEVADQKQMRSFSQVPLCTLNVAWLCYISMSRRVIGDVMVDVFWSSLGIANEMPTNNKKMNDKKGSLLSIVIRFMNSNQLIIIQVEHMTCLEAENQRFDKGP
ncbi:hypothetical protein ANCCEY_11512 [Ancylostoma ceylanicum]|uniref:Uncharacterized protein n=1 Tax=Ancylostoma ceylanicum TaxID=53326 RepID=A0A0D6LDW8_9BILA|nr:hypothetical protein ANCCEY_11512 [Ancylostoma ceylanicum]